MVRDRVAETDFTIISLCGILMFMTTPSSAWLLTERLHETFFGNGSLTAEEIEESGVRATIGSTSSKTVRRIETRGAIDDRQATQTLARDRLGNFHLSTTFVEYGGEHVQADIRSTSPLIAFDVVAGSLFVQAMAFTLASRQQA